MKECSSQSIYKQMCVPGNTCAKAVSVSPTEGYETREICIEYDKCGQNGDVVIENKTKVGVKWECLPKEDMPKLFPKETCDSYNMTCQKDHVCAIPHPYLPEQKDWLADLMEDPTG